MSSLLRSTKFVRYFTGAARTLILNSAKTAETNPLINPKAFCASNNLLLRDYATKKSESLEPLLQKLDSEVRRFGRISKRDIDEVFDEIKAKNDITSSQSLLVIRCCGELVPEELPEQRTLLVQKIWSVLTERGIPMDISHYNALLRVYIENEHPFSPAKFLEELESKGLQPNRVTYQRLMWRYCQEGDVEGATKVLERMRELNHPVSEPVLNALVMGHAFHGDTEGARAVLQTMAGAGLEPTNRTYSLLACGFAKNGDIENVEKTIQMAAEKDALLTDRDVLEIIENLALSGHSDKIESLYPHLHKSIGYNQDVCGVIFRLLNKGQIETAKNLMKTMPNSTLNETAFKGAFFIKHVLKLKKTTEEIIKICQEVKDEELVPNAFYIATEAALQQGRNDLAQKLFKELQKDGYEIRQHYYWPLLINRGKEQDEEGLLQILRDMNNENLTPSGETLRDYVIPYLIKNEKNPQNVILKLQIAGIPAIHSARSLTLTLLESAKTKMAADIATQYRLRGQYNLIARPLINALIRNKDIESFMRILHITSSVNTQINEDASNEEVQSGDQYDSAEVGRIIYSAIRNLKSPELRTNLLTAAHSKGLAIDVSSAEAIEQYLGQNMTSQISELLAKLTSPNLELAPLEPSKNMPTTRSTAQIEKLLSQVKSGEANNNVNRLQKQLLDAYIKDGDVNKMKAYLDDLKTKDFEINATTLSQLFEFYVEANEIERAEEIRSQLESKNPDYLLNKHKLVMMACALVKANRYDDAVKYLTENKSFEDDNLSFLVNSKSWQLLNSLAEAKETEKVKEMTSLLIENNYIEPSNVLLGPSIKVHLLNDDIEGALAQFEHCCGQYRSTPWKGELMKALILKEDAGKLQWLADLSTQIHGEVNILHDLVLAFVECGRLRQARRILATPGLTARAARLRDACQRYQQDGKPEFLEGLLEATKELSHIDRSNIFYHLLVTYCKSDETDKALGLWTVLQEEGEVPTTEFLLTLGNHLKLKNRDIPFVMPENPEKPKLKPESKTPEPKPQKTTVQLTKREATKTIETFVREGQLDKALESTISAIKQGVNPQSSVIKFLLRELALKGNPEKIQELGGYINENMKRDITYDDKLTLAVFNSGGGSQHIDNLYSTVQEAKSDVEFAEALRKFPRSSALATVLNDTEMTDKCMKIADIAASKNNTTPANLIWMELILSDRRTEAEKLWNKYLVDSTSIIFRRLLQEAYLNDKPEIMTDLINTLKTNKHMTHGCLGNPYSRLINYYLGKEQSEEAFKAYESAKESGVENEHINKICIKRLQEKSEATGRKFTV